MADLHPACSQCGRRTEPTINRDASTPTHVVYALDVDQRGWCSFCRWMEPVADYKPIVLQTVTVPREQPTGPVRPLPAPRIQTAPAPADTGRAHDQQDGGLADVA